MPAKRNRRSSLARRVTGALLPIFALLLAVGGCTKAGPPVLPTVSDAPREDITLSLFLIGDAGHPAEDGEPVLQAASRAMSELPEQSVALFLGDNIYSKGMPDSTAKDRADMEQRIDAQIDAVTTAGARGIFIPGNHDWWRSGDDGWNAVVRQADYVNAHADTGVQFVPTGGCPGPDVIDIGEELRLIVLDTQWWLHGGPKPVDESSGCATWSRLDIVEQLADALATAGDRKVVVAAHHPLRSNGPHGGHFTWKDHIFPLTSVKSWMWLPLPIIGSSYPLSRKGGITNQDQSSGAYETMVENFQAVFRQQPPLAYVAGHEHVLEVLEGEFVPYILVSGSGIYGHTKPDTYRDGTMYAADVAGFMRMDFLASGRVRIGVFVVDEDGNTTQPFSTFVDADDPRAPQ